MSQPLASINPSSGKKLVRRTDNAMLGGVCAGFGEYFGIDPNLIRVGVVLGTFFGAGSLAVAYLVAWLLMPEG